MVMTLPSVFWSKGNFPPLLWIIKTNLVRNEFIWFIGIIILCMTFKPIFTTLLPAK